MQLQKQIAWQKYENVIEEQLNSPMFKILSRSLEREVSDENVSNKFGTYEDEEEEFSRQEVMVGIPDDLSSEISLTSNFDCWIGHTNFDITQPVRKTLLTISGVEALKICSRYRFFIGVGKLFKFSDVRKLIESSLLES